MNDTSHLWVIKNETMSDKSVEKEYGLSRKEIIDAINLGELQFREGSMHGNPWFRLLRVEVETFIEKKYGTDYLKDRKVKKRLSEINKELKTLQNRMSILEKEKRKLLDGCSTD